MMTKSNHIKHLKLSIKTIFAPEKDCPHDLRTAIATLNLETENGNVFKVIEQILNLPRDRRSTIGVHAKLLDILEDHGYDKETWSVEAIKAFYDNMPVGGYYTL